MPGQDKGGRLRSEVDLAPKLKLAGGVGEATCAAGHISIFMVVVHARRFGRTQVPVERAEEFVTVGRKPVKTASVHNIWGGFSQKFG